MSLASQTQTTANYLAEAYSAIAEMGGTLPENKNLANLASAIDTIQVTNEGDGTLWGTLYTTSYPDGKELTYSDYLKLGNSDAPSTNITLSFGNVAKSSITKFSFGSACTFTPDYFLYLCKNLQTIEHTEVLRCIGGWFCSLCDILNCSIMLPTVSEIGNQFLYGDQLFEGEVVLGNELTKIDSSFMSICAKFTKPLTIPASVEIIGDGFMTGAINFTGTLTINTTAVPIYPGVSLACGDANSKMYANGVKLAGVGARAWKAALPNSSINPYRKLILVEEA